MIDSIHLLFSSDITTLVFLPAFPGGSIDDCYNCVCFYYSFEALVIIIFAMSKCL